MTHSGPPPTRPWPAYQSALESTDPGAGQPDITSALDQATTRLEGLSTTRNSVTNIQTDPLEAANQYSSTVNDLIRLNAEIANAADQPDLARGLQSFVNLANVKAPTAYEATLLTILVQEGRYTRWPDPSTAVGCGTDDAGNQLVPPADDEDCTLYKRIIEQQETLARNADVYRDNATVEGQQLFRDAEAGGDFNTIEAQLIEVAQSPGNSLSEDGTPITTPEAWIPTAIEKIDALQNAEDQLVTAVLDDASDLASQAQNEAFLYAVFSLGAVLLAIIIAILVGRATIGPLRRLTSAAYTLSTEQAARPGRAAAEPRRRRGRDAGRDADADRHRLARRDRPAGRRLQLDPGR